MQQELVNKLNEANAKMRNEIENLKLHDVEQKVVQQNQQSYNGSELLQEMINKKQVPDFNKILDDLNGQKILCKELENDLIRQQKEIEELLNEEQEVERVDKTIHKQAEVDTKQMEALDDLEMRIQQQLDEVNKD